jgi:hypothetical protein
MVRCERQNGLKHLRRTDTVFKVLRSGVLSAVFLLTVPHGVFAQRLELQPGIRGGIPFGIVFESGLTGVASAEQSQAYDRPPLIIGPAFTAVFNDRIGIEVDALYARVTGRGGSFSRALSTSSSTYGSSWEFPVVVDYQVLKAPAGLYFGGGIVAGQTTSGTTEIHATDNVTGAKIVQTRHLQVSTSQLPAVIVNGGIEWRSARFAIRPELRYTRWSSPSDAIIVRHPNQFEYLIGFSFRGHKD